MTDMTPRRNATQDANEGIVEPSYASKTARVTAVKRSQPSALEGATESFAESFGTMAKKFLDEEAKNRTEQAELNGKLRQGNETAINQISEDKKRGVVMSKIFGKDIEYRAAQQRAVKNNVRNMYNEQLHKVDEFSGETPDRYQLRLKDQLDTVLEDFQDDPETAAIVANEWSANAEKLATQQFKNHYAYNQQQQRATAVNELKTLTDKFTLEAQATSSPEELQVIHAQAKALYENDSAFKDPNMSDSVWNEIRQENVNQSLSEGNIGQYNLAKQTGFTEAYTPEERVKLDQAINKYDEKVQQDMYNRLDEWEIRALRMSTVEDVDDHIDAAIREVRSTALERNSGTDKYDKILSDAVLKLEKMRRKAKDVAAGKQVKQNRDRELWELKVSAPAEAAGKITNPTMIDEEGNEIPAKKYSKEEHKNAMDFGMRQLVADQLGISVDNLAPHEVMQLLYDNPALAEKAGYWYKNLDSETPIINEAVTHSLKSLNSGHFEDDAGNFNDEAVNLFTALAHFDNGSGTLAGQLGLEMYNRYKNAESAVLEGRSVKRFQEDENLLRQGRELGKAGVGRWSSQEGENGDPESNRDYVKRIFKKMRGTSVSAAQSTRDYRDFENTLMMTKQDKAAAWDRLSNINKKKVKLNGQELPKTLTNDYDFEYQDLFDYANDRGMLAGYVLLGTGTLDGEPITSTEGVDNIQYGINQATGNITLDAVSFGQPVEVPNALLAHINRLMLTSKELEIMKEEAALKRKAATAARKMNPWQTPQLF